MADLVVTWPKNVPLASYVAAIHNAKARERVINYRVARPPDREVVLSTFDPEPRLYRVHDGAVRGYTPITGILYRGKNEVERVDGEGFWPAGWYIVCAAEFTDCKPLPMKGFQGWRWFDRTKVPS